MTDRRDMCAPVALKLYRRHSTGCDSWRLYDRNTICVGFIDCTENMARRIARALDIPITPTPED